MNDPLRQLPCSSNAMLHHRDPDALGAAVDLPLDDHRVYPDAAVVDGDEAAQLHLAGPWSTSTTQMVAPYGYVRFGGHRRQTASRWPSTPSSSSSAPCDASASSWIVLPFSDPLHEPAALLPLEVVGRDLQRRGCDLPRPLAHLARDHRRGGARHRRRARAVGAEAERRLVGVAVHDLDVLGRDPELLRATICANVVSWPWPCVLTEIRRTALPVGRTRSSAPSAIPRPAMSIFARGPRRPRSR